MTTTKLHLVGDNLIDLIGTATGLQVLDGPHLGEVLPEAVVVGLTENPDQPGYRAEVARMPGVGRPRMVESWTVRCLLTITDADTDMSAVRTRAATILGLIDDAIRDNHVDTMWERASLSGGAEWIPVQHEGGATVNVLFTVVGDTIL